MDYRRMQRGSGIFACECCGRKTRNTHGSNLMLCEDCYELAGIYNVHQDGGDLVRHANAIREHCARIEAKGGKLCADFRELLALIGAAN